MSDETTRPEQPSSVHPAAHPAAAPHATVAVPSSRRRRGLLLMVALPLALVLGAGVLWYSGGRYESTENANLHQARIAIAPSVAGRVVKVMVQELQPVKAGDLLFQVDPEPYRLALVTAEARLAAARMQVEQLKAGLRQAEGQEKLARDAADYLQTDLARQEALSQKGIVSDSSLDSARHGLRQAREQADVANLAVAAARAALGNAPEAETDSHPTVQAALAELDRARYNLEVTSVTAPADGVIYQAASFRDGAMVAAGQAVFALVETGDIWVDANFKETQLAHMAPGQTVELEFDMAPGRQFTGRVAALGAGTGAEFSLLPAQNATGNWVKVTQRVPVRILLDEPGLAAGIASGASASVTVDTGHSGGLNGAAHAAPSTAPQD